MSFKRNYAAKKYNSEYLAFIDSDTYTQNWLKYSIDLIKTGNFNVIGGPICLFPINHIQKDISFCKKIVFFNRLSQFLESIKLRLEFVMVRIL